MDLNKLSSELAGRQFSVLAVTDTPERLVTGRAQRRSLKVDYVRSAERASQLIGSRHYDLLMVDDAASPPTMTAQLMHQGRKQKAADIVVVGEDVYGVRHFWAILEGADAYAPPTAGWYYEPTAGRPGGRRPKDRLRALLRDALGPYDKLATRLFNSLVKLSATFPADGHVDDVIRQAIDLLPAETRSRDDIAAAIKGRVRSILHDTAITAPEGEAVGDAESPPTMAYEFDCRTAGAQGCAWKTRAATEEELIAKVAEHARLKHKVKNVSDTIANYAQASSRSNGKGGARPHPAPSRTRPLYWNIRFPGNSAILKSEPHLVLVGVEYDFETALETDRDDTGNATVIDASKVVGRKVGFYVEAQNGEFRVPGGTTWSMSLASTVTPCGATGTEPFRVVFRPKSSGPVRIDTLLIVDNLSADRQRIHLVALDPQAGAQPAPADTGPAELKRKAGRTLASATGANWRLHLNCEAAQLFEGERYLAKAKVDSVLLLDMDRLCREQYDRLKALSSAYATLGEPNQPFRIANPDKALLELATIGAELYARLFERPLPGVDGTKMKELATNLRAVDATRRHPLVQIVAELYPVPWGLLYDRSADAGKDLTIPVDPQGFWGRRFDILRSVVTGDLPARRGTCKRIKPVIGGYVPRGEEQRLFFAEFRNGLRRKLPVVDEPAASSDELEAWTRSGTDSDFLYLFCHARPGDASSSALSFGASELDRDGPTLTDLKAWWEAQRLSNPVVFLNACSSGKADAIHGTPFVDFFADTWQAQAFIGTDWPVSASFADHFGRRVVEEFVKRKVSLRKALRTVSDEAAAQGNYFSLMYAIYGPSNVQFVKATT